MSENGDLRDGRQEMFHCASELGVPKRSVNATDEGGRNKGVSYGSRDWDVLSAKADDGSREAGGSIDNLTTQAILPSDVRDGAQGRQVQRGHGQCAHDYPGDIVEELYTGILRAIWGGKQRCRWKAYVIKVREGMIDRVG